MFISGVKRDTACNLPNKTPVPDTVISTPQTMHPEQVQVTGNTEKLLAEVKKRQDTLEEEIDVLEVETGTYNVGSNEELNGNGFFRRENGHFHQQDKEKVEVSGGENVVADINSQNGSEFKSVLRLKGSRRNSTSSRSSSVSSAPSMKHQTPMAMRMEVSMDDEDRDHMEPLIMGGAAEDLEVSMSASHDEGDEGATTDSEAIMDAVVEVASDPYEFEEDTGADEDMMILKKAKSQKSTKVIKATKSPSKDRDETKPMKTKTPRSKSLKLKESKSKQSDKIPEEFDTENSDTNSVTKEDTESEDLNIKSLKSPKRSKAPEGEADGKNSESEHAPRRSSRSRQTPQKYNSSMYVESYWDQNMSEDRMNNSDAVAGIRSVKGRRSLRKSRNISALNSSLHNESSPWDNDFKVLTPSGGGVHADVPMDDSVDISTPLKRKAIDDEDGEINERGQKKKCVENTDLDNSTSSQTSSFFSVITSPIIMLKNKFRGSSVSSTPIKENSPLAETESSEPAVLAESGNENCDNAPASEPPVVEVEATPVVETAPEARSWCAIM